MKINFTNKQFQALVKMVYLGNYIINGVRTYEEILPEFDELEQYILSFCKDFNLKEYVENYENELLPSSTLEDETSDFISDYDEYNFVDEIIHRLAQRDFYKKYGEEIISKMSFEERISKEQPFLDTYYTEIAENGVDNLIIKQ